MVPTTNRHEPGEFCWAELATNDIEAAKKFYPDLFGWNPDVQEFGEGNSYVLWMQGDHQVGGGMQQGPDEVGKIPPHWNLYVEVEDAEQSAKQAESLGGTIHAPAFDVMEFGRMSVIADPTGAVLGLWESKTDRPHVDRETNTVVWNELMTPDPDKAGAFYSELFGWTQSSFEGGPRPYTVFHNKEGDPGVAGMMPSPMEGVPPVWAVYFAVEDTDGAVEKMKAAGGQIFMGPEEISGVGRIALGTDGQNVAFGVLKPDPSGQQ